MKNKLIDLNNHLFEQLERLNDDELSGDQMDQELKRTKAMTAVAEKIIKNASLAFEVFKFNDEIGNQPKMPEMIEEKK